MGEGGREWGSAVCLPAIGLLLLLLLSFSVWMDGNTPEKPCMEEFLREGSLGNWLVMLDALELWARGVRWAFGTVQQSSRVSRAPLQLK